MKAKETLPARARFHPSRWKWLLHALIGLVLGLGGWLMVAKGNPMGWAVAGFFGLVVLHACVQTWPGAAFLELRAGDGLTVCQFFRARNYRWADVGNVEVVALPNITLVGFAWRDPQTGADRTVMLTDTYGWKPAKLAQMLELYRDEAREGG